MPTRAVLVVDDNDLNRLVVVRQLADFEVLVAQAKSADEALVRIRRGEFFAIIVSLALAGAKDLLTTIRDESPAAFKRLLVLNVEGPSAFSRINEDLSLAPFDPTEMPDWLQSLS